VRPLLAGARRPDAAAAVLFRHYASHGMAEARPHRWRCGALQERLLVAPLQRAVRAMADADPDLPGESGGASRGGQKDNMKGNMKFLLKESKHRKKLEL
jgi:hypothetical protein